jgi:xanthine/uracil permease
MDAEAARPETRLHGFLRAVLHCTWLSLAVLALAVVFDVAGPLRLPRALLLIPRFGGWVALFVGLVRASRRSAAVRWTTLVICLYAAVVAEFLSVVLIGH